MFGLTTINKLKEQELKFEDELNSRLSLINRQELRYLELLQKHEDTLTQLNVAIENEGLLNEQCGYLASELNKAKSISFPTKKFNIKKGIELLLGLSNKALATFNYQYIEALPKDQVESILKYSTNKLTKFQEENE
jgi:vacuolar-type H+-ATPase subunit I/STV1